MRPTTSQTAIREYFPFSQRPQSSKLLTSTQIKNLAGQNKTQQFQASNFGVLCDKYFFDFTKTKRGFVDTNKPTQLQKFGRSSNTQTVQKKAVQVQVKKLHVYKLIEVDARMRDDPETITEREKDIQYRRTLLVIINDNVIPHSKLQLVFNKQSIPLNVKITNMFIKKKRSKGKAEARTIIKFQDAKKILLLKNPVEYLQEYINYENKKISLDTEAVGMFDLVDEFHHQKDFEVMKEQRKFIIEMPKLIVYTINEDQNMPISLTNLQLTKLIQSDFKDIDQYNNQIDEVSYQLLPKFDYQFKIMEGTLTKEEKIIKKITFYNGEYCQISFTPPLIKIHDKNHQLGAYHFSIKEYQLLCDYVFTNSIKSFLGHCIKQVPHQDKVRIILHFPEVPDPLKNELAQKSAENGILMDQDFNSEYTISYISPKLEFYIPEKCEKQQRVLYPQEFQRIIDYDFNFALF